jgi:hypothetical protein
MDARYPQRTATIAIAAAFVLVALALPEPAGAPVAAAGGTFRVISTVEDFDFVDPALAYRTTSFALLDASCALLLNYPDRRRAFKPVPEVAAGRRSCRTTRRPSPSRYAAAFGSATRIHRVAA